MSHKKRILILFSLSFCSLAFADSNMLKNSILNVCTTAAYKPIVYKLPTGKLAGVAPDILKGFAAKEGLTLRYVVISLNGLIPSLLANKCQLIASGMIATNERKKIINFTLGMYKSQSYIIYAKNNKKLNNTMFLKDFNKNNLTVGIELGNIYQTFIQNNNPISKANIHIYDSGSDIATALISHKVDFTFNGSQFLNSLSKAKLNEFNYIKLDITNDDVAFGLRKNDEALLRKMNEYIEEINKNGSYTKILEKNDVQFTVRY